MIDVKQVEKQKRAEKAKKLRYKKAVAIEMNLDAIRQWISETYEALDDVTYVEQNEQMFLDVFDGDEEEAFEFRAAFQSLSADIDSFSSDLGEEWIPDCFDDFFCAVSGSSTEYAGYDVVEQDYFGLSTYAAVAGQGEAQKRLERLTKKDLIEAAQRCYQVAVAYLGLKSRFEDLRAAVDIIRAENDGLLQGIKAIEALYDRWSKAKNGPYGERAKIDRELEAVVDQMPDEVWVR